MKSVKKIILAIIAFSFFYTLPAQHADWKELGDFHLLMSNTFHPAEKGDLQPLREKAEEMLAKAKLWQSAAIPADFDKELTKKILIKLVAKCEEINKAVKAKKSDADLIKLITEAHDIFHEIVEKCHKHE